MVRLAKRIGLIEVSSVREFSAQIRRLAMVWLGAFALLALAAGYWQVVAAPALEANPNNTRAEERLSLTQPGNVYASDGTLIMGAEKVAESWEPTYPDPAVFCHLTGYNARSGLQAGLREALLGLGKYANGWQALIQGRLRGDDVYLTINAAAQQAATEAMTGRRGAVVALDPRDGAIRVLVSAPGYNPEALRNPDAYEVFRTDPFSPELDRALQGLYTPGSALKVMTAAIGLQAGAARPDTIFSCQGEEILAGTRVVCVETKGHGKITLTEALAKSCNIAFAKLGLMIGAERYRQGVKAFHLLDAANLPLPSKHGGMADLTGPKGKALLAHTAYGQGETVVTPLAMARMVATIADGGEVIQPYLVGQVRNAKGQVLETGQGRDLGRACSRQTARVVAGMMVQAVENGTAGAMAIRGVKVAAKTGTAQKGQGKPDVWMLAFAPAEKPTVAVAVVVEGGVSGAETAGPVAREVLRALLGG
jgi:peptidoglycan glycosyltransferase